jgi:hypothetical protein
VQRDALAEVVVFPRQAGAFFSCAFISLPLSSGWFVRRKVVMPTIARE